MEEGVLFETESETDGNEQSEGDCICPVCVVDFEADEENVRRISCDKCLRWWHVNCLGLTSLPENYLCGGC